MQLAGFEPAVPTSERQQTQTLDRAVTGISKRNNILLKNYFLMPDLIVVY
jgi:hypothetical protein